MAAADAAGAARSASRGVSLHSSERILSVSVPDAERKLVRGELHSFYTIRTTTTTRSFTVEKRFSEMRAAHEQLGALFPHRFAGDDRRRHSVDSADGAVHDAASSVLVDVDLRAPALDRKKRTSRTMEARRIALETYLRQLLGDPSMGVLLLSVLLASASALPEHARAVTAAVEEAAGGGGAMPAAAAAGAARSSGSIIAAAPPANLEPPPPPQLEYAARAVREERDGSVVTPELGGGEGGGPWAPGTRVGFALDDMDAFDCLLENGYAVVPLEPAGEGTAGVPSLPPGGEALLRPPGGGERFDAPPQPGQWVALSLATLAWDGASSAAVRLDALPLAAFALGDVAGSCSPGSGVPPGLHAVLPMLSPGASATVVLAPARGFGDAGILPLLPAGAHMVLQLTLHAVSGAPRDMSAFQESAAPRGDAAADEGADRFGTGGAVRIAADAHPVGDDELAAWEADVGLAPAPAPPPPQQQQQLPTRRQRVTLIGPQDAAPPGGAWGAGTGLAPPPPAPAPASAPSTGNDPPPMMAEYLRRQASVRLGGWPPAPAGGGGAVGGGGGGHGALHRSGTAPPDGMRAQQQHPPPPLPPAPPPRGGGGPPGVGGGDAAGGGVTRNAEGRLVDARGRVMPSPEEAERAFREYVRSQGGQLPPEPKPPAPAAGSSKKRGLFRALSFGSKGAGGGGGAGGSALLSSDGVGEVVTAADLPTWEGAVPPAQAAPPARAGGLLRGLLGGGGRTKSVFSS